MSNWSFGKSMWRPCRRNSIKGGASLTKQCLRLTFLKMHATIYGRGQMVIPAEARRQAKISQGDVVEVQPDGDGRIVLIRLEPPKSALPRKARITYRKGTHAIGSTGNQ